jgi:glycosyltransferase involved in cell wall biosynthesis
VVVTDIPANRHWIINGQNGFLFKPGDYNTLAEKVIMLLSNKELRESFGGKSRQIVLERANQKIEMAKIEKIYLELIDKFA